MINKPYRSPMPGSWRIALFVAVILGAIGGFVLAWFGLERPQPDVVMYLVYAGLGAGLLGGLVVVAWFLFRTTSDTDVDIGDPEDPEE